MQAGKNELFENSEDPAHQGKKSLVELTFFHQTLSFAADTSQPVGQKRGAKQVQPCQRCTAEGVGNADEKVCQTEQPHHLSNFVQVGDCLLYTSDAADE